MIEPTYHLQHVVKSRNEEPEDFSGPLDVILLLLSKNKIEIRDIQISVILEQYLAYLDEMKRMDLEIASEFISMASHLVLIKTKMLLSEAEQQEGLSEMELLIQSLEQRQRQEILEKIKEPAAWLESRNDIGRNIFTKEPEPLRKDQTYRYQHDRSDLIRALMNMQERSDTKLPSPINAFVGIVGKEPYPVEKKAAEMLKALIAKGRQKLRSLFRGNRSRSEVVATFLSILELCKLRSVRVTEDNGELQVDYLKMPEESEVEP
ncbi:MAG: segregation/condensation protein A [Oscillospiraceae bacterium]|nr:segregation/condensation protein A [Oscillospiraceae bacterium]